MTVTTVGLMVWVGVWETLHACTQWIVVGTTQPIVFHRLGAALGCFLLAGVLWCGRRLHGRLVAWRR